MDRELAWRKRELSSLRSDVASAAGPSEDMLCRAGAALLYAHWEGFTKQVATRYLTYVADQQRAIEDLNVGFAALALRKELRRLTSEKEPVAHRRFVRAMRADALDVSLPDRSDMTETEGNLNWEVFTRICLALDLDNSEIATQANVVDQKVVGNRHNVAHGHGIQIAREDYYATHTAVIALLDWLRDSVETAIVDQLYLVSEEPLATW